MSDPQTPCLNCGESFKLSDLYRCRICHLRYCDKCALKHFGLYEDKKGKVKYKNIFVTMLWLVRKSIIGK